MTACPLCGHRNPAGATECTACGHELVTAEAARSGKFFTPLACGLMFGVPVAATTGIIALAWVDATVGLGLGGGAATSILLSLAAIAASVVGSAAGWAVAARRRWDLGLVGLIVFAVLGAGIGLAFNLGTWMAASFILPW